MDKKTKIVLGVAALGVVAYYLFKKSKSTTAFANQIGGNIQPVFIGGNAPVMCEGYRKQCPDGKVYCVVASTGYRCPTAREASLRSSVLTKQQTLQKGRVSGN
jgi:hypothetical protein